MTTVLLGVGKRWSRRRPWVLRDVDLELPPGSLTVLTGVNGSGKSTLLRVAAGLTRPTCGRLYRSGQRIAVVPDRFHPPARMSAADFLRHLGRARGLSPRHAMERGAELACRLGFTTGMAAPMSELSKGNAQKVLLAQAFLTPVDLLALDEPGTALDPPGREALEGLIEDARDSGAAVLMSDPTRSRSGCLRIVEGRLQSALDRAGPVDVVLIARDAGDMSRLEREFGADAFGRPEQGRVRVTVDRGRSDHLLKVALHDGWSVEELLRRERE